MITRLKCIGAAAGIGICLSPAMAQVTDLGDPGAAPAAGPPAMSEAEAQAVDPWEGFNRKMYAVNNVVDGVVLVPAAKTYRAVTFKKQRRGIRNFLDNLATPVTLVNDLLQGEFKRAGETASRFVINTTIGFGGMGDPAERIGIPQHSEDFGQTLAVWGAPQGPYLFLPVFGPSSVRAGIGAGVGIAMTPSTWIRTDAASIFRSTSGGMNGISIREPLIEPLAEIKANSLDEYASFRSFYLQSRKREIANGRTNFDDLPDIGDFDEFDDLE
ncbi:MAG: VacJ family lipoprotein [Pseudomonadota bacterium]